MVHISTRANIELYDGWQLNDEITRWQKGAVLYHHCDGYPSWMGPRLEEWLKQIKDALDQAGHPYWWDSERVGALMVKLSGDEDPLKNGVPAFQPGIELHGDINYLWRVFLITKQCGKYEIKCYAISHDWEKDLIKHLEEVDWRKEIEREQRR